MSSIDSCLMLTTRKSTIQLLPRQEFLPELPNFSISLSPSFIERTPTWCECLETRTNLLHTPQRLQHRMDATAQWRRTSSGPPTSPGRTGPCPQERPPTAQAS